MNGIPRAFAMCHHKYTNRQNTHAISSSIDPVPVCGAVLQLLKRIERTTSVSLCERVQQGNNATIQHRAVFF